MDHSTRRWDEKAHRFIVYENDYADIGTGIHDYFDQEAYVGDFIIFTDKPIAKAGGSVIGSIQFGGSLRTHEICDCRIIEFPFVGVYVTRVHGLDDEFYQGRFQIVGNYRETPEMAICYNLNEYWQRQESKKNER